MMTTTPLTKESIVYLPRGVRIKEDKVRERTVLVAPERTVALDEIGVAILAIVDGEKTLADIVEELSIKYNAPKQEIGNDVVAFLRDLQNRGYLDVKP
ncbi:MAG: pyrroloquinoline quinone biosynthesis peptide chaperone PqqD [Hyphomicrobiales bacterium]